MEQTGTERSERKICVNILTFSSLNTERKRIKTRKQILTS